MPCLQRAKKGRTVGAGGKKKSCGGARRTCCLPCGHIVRGVRQRLGAELRLHQKVCSICEGQDFSDYINRPAEHENLTDLKGGTNYRHSKKGTDATDKYSNVTVWNGENGTDACLRLEGDSGNITQNLSEFGQVVQAVGGADCPDVEVMTLDELMEKVMGSKKETKTQKKRRMRKNKKEREYNVSIGLGEKTVEELNPFELDFMIKKQVEEKYK